MDCSQFGLFLCFADGTQVGRIAGRAQARPQGPQGTQGGGREQAATARTTEAPDQEAHQCVRVLRGGESGRFRREGRVGDSAAEYFRILIFEVLYLLSYIFHVRRSSCVLQPANFLF